MAKVLEYQLHTGIFLMSMGGDRVDIYTSDQTVVYSVPVVTGSTYTVTMLEIGNRFGVAFSTIDPTTITQTIENGATRITFNGPSVGQEIPYTAAEDGWILIYVSSQNERPLISVVTDGVGGDGSESESVLKIVNATQLDAALKSTADAIRAKTGGTENIPWSETEGFKSAVEGISGTAVPDGSAITFGNQNGEPVERLEAYAILGTDLNAIGAITQKMAGKSALMTVADMIYWLNRVQFIPQGNAMSSFSLPFDSVAIGILPDVQKGTATSEFSLSFTASAVGELQEG